MKKIVIKDRRYTGKKALLVEIKDRGDGSYDVKVNSILSGLLEIVITSDQGDRVKNYPETK